MPEKLPTVESCLDCGACCSRTPLPPFAPGEAELLNLPTTWYAPINQRIAAGLEFALLPCVWYDQSNGLCLHYDHRPAACREFEVDGQGCRSVRQLHLAAKNAEPAP